MTIKRTVQGVGYNSGGKHKVSINCVRTKTYMTWYDMIKRCYNKKLQERVPGYKGCSVSDEWHDFQVFAEWYESQPFRGKGYELDKDLLFKGNKIYSEKTVCLIPQEINKLLMRRKRKDNGLTGAYLVKSSGLWAAQIYMHSKLITIGFFDTEIEAHEAYMSSKQKYVREVAMQWKDSIDSAAFEALLNRYQSGVCREQF